MGFPAGVTLVQVTGQNLRDLAGNPAVSGVVRFKASGQLADPTHGLIIVNIELVSTITNGVMAPVELPVNDATVNPHGFTIAVRQEIYYQLSDGSTSKTPVLDIYNVSLDSSLLPSADLAELAPVGTFTPVLGVTITNQGSPGQTLINTGNQTAEWQTTGSSGALLIANNLSDVANRQTALNNLTGTQTAGRYLRSNGTNSSLSTIQGADLPTLDAIPSPAANVSWNNKKITLLANATNPQDAVAFSQVPTIGAAGAGAGVALSANDPTTTNARSPLAHASTHAIGGSDLLTPDSIGAVSAGFAEMCGLGLLTADPRMSGVTYQLTPGDLVLCLMTPSKTKTISSLAAWVTAAGVTGSGVNALMLYSEAGVLIDQTGDMTATWSSTGMVEGAMGASHTVTVGTNYYLGFLTHFSGTSPHFAATGTTQTANFPVTNGHYLAIYKSGQASVPSTIVPASFTPNSGYFILSGR